MPDLSNILAQLEHPQAEEALARLRGGLKLSKAYVDKTKLTDHHAIIPTGQRPSPSLSAPLRRVYELVTTRFVGVFLPEHIVEETIVLLDVGGASFIGRGNTTLQEGWKILERRKDDKPERENGMEEEAQTIPPLQKGQTVHIESMDVREKETKPPSPYTDATLLTAMKNAGRQIEDDELAAAMKESGLGTPATRADTIERLLRSSYIRREKKSLRATEKGRALIELVAEPLRSPELTGQWEQRLKEVEEGDREGATFYRDIAEFVRSMVPQVAEGKALTPEQVTQAREAQNGRRKGRKKRTRGGKSVVLGTCPKCKEGEIRESPKAYGCSRYREGCNLTIWKKTAGKDISPKLAKDLLTDGHTEHLDGFTSRAGKPFSARLKFDEDFKVVFEFENGPSGGAQRKNLRRNARTHRQIAARPLWVHHLRWMHRLLTERPPPWRKCLSQRARPHRNPIPCLRQKQHRPRRLTKRQTSPSSAAPNATRVTSSRGAKDSAVIASAKAVILSYGKPWRVKS